MMHVGLVTTMSRHIHAHMMCVGLVTTHDVCWSGDYNV